MDKQLLDLYTDYLISSFSQTTATGISNALDGEISHDRFTRFLAKEDLGSKDLWKIVKPFVRKIESANGIIAVDDTIEEKLYTDENDIISWHFDHALGRNVKGVNILNFLYHNDGVSFPVAFDVIKKTKEVLNPTTGKMVRKSEKTKNEIMREVLLSCVQDMRLVFSLVIADTWFSSCENMTFIKETLKKDFIIPLKCNRKIALSALDKRRGRYTSIESIIFKEDVPITAYLEGVLFPVLLLKQVFTNEDESQGVLYLCSSDTACDAETLKENYQKRWKIEEYHKSLKSNAGLAKSPTQTVRTQINHFFMAMVAFVKLEKLKIKTGLNHFALKAKLYVRALRSSMDELTQLKKLRVKAA